MNPYEELGLDPSATEEEIRQKYKSLAQQHHPDRGGDEEKFKRIKFAYEILSNPTSRREYDTTGRINKDVSSRNIALEELSNLAFNLIPNINPVHDDLILIMRNKINQFKINTFNNIQICQTHINNLEKIIARIKRKKEGENIIRSIAETQLKQRQDELINFKRQLQINDEMLQILEDYHYSTEEWTLFLQSQQQPPSDVQ